MSFTSRILFGSATALVADEMLLRVLDYDAPILAPSDAEAESRTGAGRRLPLELVGLGEPSPDLPSQEIFVATIKIISATTSLDGFHLTEEAQQADDALRSPRCHSRRQMWWPTVPAQERSRYECFAAPPCVRNP